MGDTSPPSRGETQVLESSNHVIESNLLSTEKLCSCPLVQCMVPFNDNTMGLHDDHIPASIAVIAGGKRILRVEKGHLVLPPTSTF